MRSDLKREDWESPAHYVAGRKYEPLDVIEDWQLDFHLGQVVKYVARAGRKGGSDGALYDLNKAAVYLRRKIALLEAEQQPRRDTALEQQTRRAPL